MSRPLIAALSIAGLASGLAGPVHAAAFSFSTIDAPGATSTSLTGINAAGQITGNAGGVAFVDTAGTFTTINVPGITQFAPTVATGINNNGQITGYYPGSYGYLGFIDTSGSFTTVQLGRPGVDTTMPNGINDSGVLVGTTTTGFGGPQAYATVSFVGSSTLTIPDAAPANAGPPLFTPPHIYVSANGINDAGQVVGTYDSLTFNNDVGFLDAAGVISLITAPGAIPGSTVPTGINNSGEISGFYTMNDTGYHSFVDINGTFTTFDVPGSIAGTTIAEAVNDLGDVVGSYQTASGTQGFLATPVSNVAVPEPASVALLGMSVAGFGVAAWRRRR